MWNLERGTLITIHFIDFFFFFFNLGQDEDSEDEVLVHNPLS